MESMTIAESRVDQMQRALLGLVRINDVRIPAIARELAEIRKAVESAAKSIYDATPYDPEGEETDDAC
jgi:hypothetical protein